MEITEKNAEGIIILHASSKYEVVHKEKAWYFKNVKFLKEFEQSSFKEILRIIGVSKVIFYPKPKIYEIW